MPGVTKSLPTLLLTVLLGGSTVASAFVVANPFADEAPVADAAAAVEEAAETVAPAPVDEVDATDWAERTNGIVSVQDDVLHDRAHVVALDADGGFDGRLTRLGTGGSVSPVSGLTVKVLQDGVVLGSSETTEDGVFRIERCNTGTVALIAYADDALLLYSLRVVEAGSEPAKLIGDLDLDVDSAVVAGANVETAVSLIRPFLYRDEFRDLGEFTSDLEEFGDEDYSNEFPHGDGPLSTSVQHHSIQLGADGILRGQVNVLHEENSRHVVIENFDLYFLRNGEISASCEVSHDGKFQVTGLTPGVYGIVGVGDHGVLALSIDVLGSETLVGDATPVAVTQALNLVVAPVSLNNINQQNFDPTTDNTFNSNAPAPGVSPGAFAPGGLTGPAGTGGGGLGGATGGGGAGAASGGGDLLGTLLGAGAGALIGNELSDDDPAAASPGF